MTDVDTLRWGDTDTLRFFEPAQPGEVTFKGTKQLVQAHWKRPLTWKLLIVVVPKLDPTETSTFIVQVLIQVGSGSAIANFTLPVTVAPTGGVYAVSYQSFFDIPAQDVQIRLAIDVSGSFVTRLQSWTLTALIAPFTEPAGYTDTSEMLRQVTENVKHGHMPTDPDNAQLPRWMPEGFDDGELRYR